VVQGLPVPRLERLSLAGYAVLKTILFPRHRWLTQTLALERARALADGVERLAERYGARFVPSPLEWYGLDPIHVSPFRWARAWKTILFAPEGEGRPPQAPPPGTPSALRLFLLRPDAQRLFGRELRQAQPSLRLPGGGTVSLF
jgi:hypothetical protein